MSNQSEHVYIITRLTFLYCHFLMFTLSCILSHDRIILAWGNPWRTIGNGGMSIWAFQFPRKLNWTQDCAYKAFWTVPSQATGASTGKSTVKKLCFHVQQNHSQVKPSLEDGTLRSCRGYTSILSVGSHEKRNDPSSLFFHWSRVIHLWPCTWGIAQASKWLSGLHVSPKERAMEKLQERRQMTVPIANESAVSDSFKK